MDPKILLLLLVGGYFFLNSQNNTLPAGTARLPDGRIVPVAQLPSLGYIYYSGRAGGSPGWYHSSQFPRPPGYQANSPQWIQWLQTALNAGNNIGDIIAQIQNLWPNATPPQAGQDIYVFQPGGEGDPGPYTPPAPPWQQNQFPGMYP